VVLIIIVTHHIPDEGEDEYPIYVYEKQNFQAMLSSSYPTNSRPREIIFLHFLYISCGPQELPFMLGE
jgi:hypothetical protein